MVEYAGIRLYAISARFAQTLHKYNFCVQSIAYLIIFI